MSPAAPASAPLALTADPADPPAGPPVVPAEQRPRGTAPVAAPAPPVASLAVLAWLGGINPGEVPEPLSVTVAAVTHTVHVSVATPDAFRQWCAELSIPPGAVRRDSSPLGIRADATTTTTGWAVHVSLFGDTAEELL